MTDREWRIQSALRTYENTSWVEPSQTVIKRRACVSAPRSCYSNCSTAKASRTRSFGIFGMPNEGSGFAPSDEHYVVIIGAEAIDATPTSIPLACARVEVFDGVKRSLMTPSIDPTSRGSQAVSAIGLSGVPVCSVYGEALGADAARKPRTVVRKVGVPRGGNDRLQADAATQKLLLERALAP